MLALTKEGHLERSRLRSNNEEQFSPAYESENRFERFATLAPEIGFAEPTKLTQITCAICFEDFNHLNLVRKTQCSHSYHSDCLKMWSKHELSEKHKIYLSSLMPLLQLSPQWIQDKPIDAKIHHLYENLEEYISVASRSEPTPQVNVQVFVIYPSLID